MTITQTPNISQPDPLFWLYADNYRTYNIEVARKLGSINAAILLSELSSRYRYHRQRNELINDEKHGDGWFYYTSEDVEERTMLTRRHQDSAIETLENLGLIEKKLIGVPSKRHFRLNLEKINEFFISGVQPRLYENAKLDCTKTPNKDVRIRQTSHIIEEHKKEPNKEPNNTPYSPPPGDAANAADDGIDPPIERPPEKKCSDAAKQLEIQIIQHMRSVNDKWNAPNSHLLAHHCDEMMRLGYSVQDILNVVLWALKCEFRSGMLFKKKTNPGTVLLRNIDDWYVRMKNHGTKKPQGVNAEKAEQIERAVKSMESMREGAL